MHHLAPTPPDDQDLNEHHASPESSTMGEQSQTPEAQPAGKEVASKPLTVVGIGASAGGLAALQGFFDALPADTGMAFAVVTHMDPEKESLLPELLQRHTAMPVQEVGDLVPIEPNHVYVMPPGQRILVTDTHLDVEAFEEPRGQRMPIDHFFRTLASVHREGVAIVLSGGGTDGAVGVKAVKEEGGLLMVQHPDEAEHDSMPRAAIATGLADVVLPVAQLAQKLAAYRRNGARVPRDPQALTDEDLETVYRILTQVQVHTGHDFSQYKRSTILRRIQRRMQLHSFSTLDAYLDSLRHEPTESFALFNDLLIGVTNFFRDQEAWQTLAEMVIPRLFEGKSADEAVRVWSIGCATGEEAFSLGMLLLEHSATLELPRAVRPTVQVFASDLDEGALHKARDGVYPEAIEADVSPERLARFFVKEGHYYRVKQELRDIVLFSNHNVLRDPPFSRLDLISCRNLLIYLNRDLQENVFQIFHYALNPEHFLFLGSSESAEMVHGLFRTTDKSHRIYQARPWRGEYPRIPSLPLTVRLGSQQSRLSGTAARRYPVGDGAAATTGLLHHTLLEESAPPSILVDDQHHVLHISETAGRYLLHPRGVVTDDLLKLVRPELQYELRTALLQVFTQDKSVLTPSIYVPLDGAAQRVILAVYPTSGERSAEEGENGDSTAEKLALVFFLEDTSSAAAGIDEADSLAPASAGEQSPPAGQRDALLSQLETEVQRLRERLQSTTEEYESSNEELKAANEELQSINEEYRSTTEELETSKEELQSVNEELQTVNAELKNKLEEIARANSDLENLIVSTDIATLFLDRELRIERYTPTTSELFNIMPGDRGRPIGHLTNRLHYDDLAEDAARVLQSLVPIEREVQDLGGRWLLARLRPYRSADNRIDGVVLTFVDITVLKSAEEALRREKEFSEKIVHTVREGMLALRPDLTVEFANEPFFEMFSVDRRETIGRLIYGVGNGQWDFPELRSLLEERLPQTNIVNDYRLEHVFEPIGRRVLLLNVRRMDEIERVLLAIEDITEREQYEEDLRQSEARYRTLFESMDQGFCVIEVLFDDGEAVDYRFLETNPAFEGQTGLRNAVGKQMRHLEPRHEKHWFETYGRIALTGKPERFTNQAKRLGNRWYDVFAFRIGQPDEHKVAVLFNDITKRKRAEEELRQLNELLEERVEQRTKQVRELAGQLSMAEREERARIAQVLHDDLQQQLYSLQIQLEFLRAASNNEALLEEIAGLEQFLTAAMSTARQLSVDLSPPILEGEGLVEALKWLRAQMQERYQLHVRLDTKGSLPRPPSDLRVLLFQMVRELLFNVVKHAQVAEAQVTAQVVDDPEIGKAYRIDVVDKGVGIDPQLLAQPDTSSTGRGLLHMRERLRFIDGRLKLAALPGGGTRVTVLAPLPAALATSHPAGEEE
ncbi:MAG: chemotaxis protein CheB [Anaerolineae bacterium]|nr:chemotaxis protein CheB [Anaerolineae bacterium]